MNIFIKDLKNLKTDFVCQLYTLLLSSKPFGILFFRRNVIVPQGEIIMITFYEGYESISAMKTMAGTFFSEKFIFENYQSFNGQK